MEFDKEHDEIIHLTHELKAINIQCMCLKRAYEEARIKWEDCKNTRMTAEKRIKQLEDIIESGTIFQYVENIEEVNTLTKEELTAIYNGMDKTNYNQESTRRVYPRFIDLERLVKMTIDIKKKFS